MTAYSKLQPEEFSAQELGYRAVTHQRFVGTGYFDEIAQVVSSGNSSTTALAGSTEAEQFHGAVPLAPANGQASEGHAWRTFPTTGRGILILAAVSRAA